MQAGGWFALGLIAFAAMLAARDSGFAVHMRIVSSTALGLPIFAMRSAAYAGFARGLVKMSAERLLALKLADFVFWGYRLFIVLAATGYLLGIAEGKEYAEPEWYVALWLTIVWVRHLIVFGGTVIKRSESHIYMADWFHLAFITTIAMLHIVSNFSMPVSLLGSKS